jgi:hypothetical protein
MTTGLTRWLLVNKEGFSYVVKQWLEDLVWDANWPMYGTPANMYWYLKWNCPDWCVDAFAEGWKAYVKTRPKKRLLKKTSRFVSERSKMTPRLRFSVLARCNFTCQACGRKAPDVVLHVDHIVPISKGGLSRFDNLQALCQECNIGKGAKLLGDLCNQREGQL